MSSLGIRSYVARIEDDYYVAVPPDPSPAQLVGVGEPAAALAAGRPGGR